MGPTLPKSDRLRTRGSPIAMSNPLEYFGLERAPFADALPAAGVVGTRALRRVVSRIQAALRDGSPRIAVIGESGIGKSCLAAALPGLFAGSTRVALVADPEQDWRTLRAALVRAWSLEGERLSRGALVSATSSSRLVLVVDRAEQAPESLLAHLDALQEIRDADGDACVTLIVFVRSSGESAGESSPVLDWLERSNAARVPYEPLAADAVGDYIERSLRRAGWDGPPLFTPRAALAIHAETGGIPGSVAKLCEQLLGEAAQRRLRSIDEPFVRTLGERATGVAERVVPDEREVWDDADHHPRETKTSELLLEAAVPDSASTSTRRPADAEGEANGDPALEAYLSAPTTAEELRAIRGGFLRRNARSLLALSAAIAAGGLLLASIRPAPGVRSSAEAGGRPDATLASSASASGNAAVLHATAPFETSTSSPLGRPRGPILAPIALPPSPMGAETRPRSPAPEPSPDGLPDASPAPLIAAGDVAESDRSLAVRPPAQAASDLDESLGAEEAQMDLRPTDVPPPAGYDTPELLP